MIIVAAVLLGALTVPLFGGRFRGLADAQLRRGWCLLAALAGQILITSIMPDLPSTFARTIHLATYVLATMFLWSNRRIVGLWIVAIGAGLNVLAITLNSGVMPASTAALRRAGLDIAGRDFRNSAPVPHARLSFLGDVFAIPIGWPFANVFSVGDVLIVIGVVLALHELCGSHVRPHRRSTDDRLVSWRRFSGEPAEN